MVLCKVYVTNAFILCVCLSRIYYWYDERGKKTKCTAPQYVDFVMSLCQKLVTDEEIFPTKYGECLLLCVLGGGKDPQILTSVVPLPPAA